MRRSDGRCIDCMSRRYCATYGCTHTQEFYEEVMEGLRERQMAKDKHERDQPVTTIDQYRDWSHRAGNSKERTQEVVDCYNRIRERREKQDKE